MVAHGDSSCGNRSTHSCDWELGDSASSALLIVFAGLLVTLVAGFAIMRLRSVEPETKVTTTFLVVHGENGAWKS